MLSISRRCLRSLRRASINDVSAVYQNVSRTRVHHTQQRFIYDSEAVIKDTTSMPTVDFSKVDTSSSVVRAVHPNGIVVVTGVPDAEFMGLLSIFSTVPGVGPVNALIVRIHEDEVYASLYCKSHSVNQGDSVSMAADPYPSFPLGSVMLGRSVSSVGHAIDGLGPVNTVSSQSLMARDFRSLVSRTRCSVAGEWMATGIRALDLLRPLRRGTKIAYTEGTHEQQVDLALSVMEALAAQNGGLRHVRDYPSAALLEHVRRNAESWDSEPTLVEDLEASLSPDSVISPPVNGNVFVWASVNQSPAHLDLVQRAIRDMNIRHITTVIAADNSCPAAEQQQCLPAAVALACYYRRAGLHCTLIVDDMAQHARALEATLRVKGQPHPQLLSSLQAQALEPVGVEGPGAGTVTALLLSSPQEQPPGPQALRQEMWLRALHSLVDQSLTLDAEAAAEGRWPPLSLEQLTATLKLQTPVLGRVAQQLARLLRDSEEARERAQFGEELGLSTDLDVEEVIDWGLKAKLFLAQRKEEFIPPHAQVLSCFALSQPRLLAGISPEDIHGWDDFLMAEARAHPGMMARLRDEVNVSACKEPCTHPGVGTGEWGLTDTLQRQLEVFVEDTHNKYLLTQ